MRDGILEVHRVGAEAKGGDLLEVSSSSPDDLQSGRRPSALPSSSRVSSSRGEKDLARSRFLKPMTYSPVVDHRAEVVGEFEGELLICWILSPNLRGGWRVSAEWSWTILLAEENPISC
jgi:hypothetical protein